MTARGASHASPRVTGADILTVLALRAAGQPTNMFRGNSSVDRANPAQHRKLYGRSGPCRASGRVAQAAEAEEKWVPKPKGPRRGSGRTRSAAREEAVRPLLQIVELLRRAVICWSPEP